MADELKASIKLKTTVDQSDRGLLEIKKLGRTGISVRIRTQGLDRLATEISTKISAAVASGFQRAKPGSLLGVLGGYGSVNMAGHRGRVGASTVSTEFLRIPSLLSKINQSIIDLSVTLKNRPTVDIDKKPLQSPNTILTNAPSVPMPLAISEISNNADKAKKSFDKLEAPIKTAGNEGKKTSYVFGQVFERMVRWVSAGLLMFNAIRMVSNAWRTMISTEQDIISINKLMIEQGNISRELGKTVLGLGKRYAVSFGEAATAMKEFARQGFNLEQTKQLADAVLFAGTIGEFKSQEEAVKATVAAIKQFDMSMSDAKNVLVSYTTVARKHAVSEQDLSDAMRRSGSIAKMAGMSFNEMIGLATAIGAATQKSGREVGTAMNSILTRIRQPAAIKALDDIGIKTRMANGEFMNAMSVLEQLAGKWDTLTESQQQSLQVLGQRRTMQYLVAGLQNFAEAQQAVDDSTSATLVAYKQSQMHLDSLAAHIQKTKNAFTDMVMGYSQSGMADMMKNMLGSVTALASGFAMLTNSTTAFGATALATTAGAGGIWKVLTKQPAVQQAAVQSATGVGTASVFGSIGLSVANMAKTFSILGVSILAIMLVLKYLVPLIDRWVNATKYAREAAEKAAADAEIQAQRYKVLQTSSENGAKALSRLGGAINDISVQSKSAQANLDSFYRNFNTFYEALKESDKTVTRQQAMERFTAPEKAGDMKSSQILNLLHGYEQRRAASAQAIVSKFGAIPFADVGPMTIENLLGSVDRAVSQINTQIDVYARDIQESSSAFVKKDRAKRIQDLKIKVDEANDAVWSEILSSATIEEMRFISKQNPERLQQIIAQMSRKAAAQGMVIKMGDQGQASIAPPAPGVKDLVGFSTAELSRILKTNQAEIEKSLDAIYQLQDLATGMNLVKSELDLFKSAVKGVTDQMERQHKIMSGFTPFIYDEQQKAEMEGSMAFQKMTTTMGVSQKFSDVMGGMSIDELNNISLAFGKAANASQRFGTTAKEAMQEAGGAVESIGPPVDKMFGHSDYPDALKKGGQANKQFSESTEKMQKDAAHSIDGLKKPVSNFSIFVSAMKDVFTGQMFEDVALDWFATTKYGKAEGIPVRSPKQPAPRRMSSSGKIPSRMTNRSAVAADISLQEVFKRGLKEEGVDLDAIYDAEMARGTRTAPATQLTGTAGTGAILNDLNSIMGDLQSGKTDKTQWEEAAKYIRESKSVVDEVLSTMNEYTTASIDSYIDSANKNMNQVQTSLSTGPSKMDFGVMARGFDRATKSLMIGKQMIGRSLSEGFNQSIQNFVDRFTSDLDKSQTAAADTYLVSRASFAGAPSSMFSGAFGAKATSSMLDDSSKNMEQSLSATQQILARSESAIAQLMESGNMEQAMLMADRTDALRDEFQNQIYAYDEFQRKRQALEQAEQDLFTPVDELMKRKMYQNIVRSQPTANIPTLLSMNKDIGAAFNDPRFKQETMARARNEGVLPSAVSLGAQGEEAAMSMADQLKGSAEDVGVVMATAMLSTIENSNIAGAIEGLQTQGMPTINFSPLDVTLNMGADLAKALRDVGMVGEAQEAMVKDMLSQVSEMIMIRQTAMMDQIQSLIQKNASLGGIVSNTMTNVMAG